MYTVVYLVFKDPGILNRFGHFANLIQYTSTTFESTAVVLVLYMYFFTREFISPSIYLFDMVLVPNFIPFLLYTGTGITGW
jgi:hypothetical protein